MPKHQTPGVLTYAEMLPLITAELASARRKFPNPSGSLAALTEEVGELAKAVLDETARRVVEEAVQVAVMAIRIATEGDPTLDQLRIQRGNAPLSAAPDLGPQTNTEILDHKDIVARFLLRGDLVMHTRCMGIIEEHRVTGFDGPWIKGVPTDDTMSVEGMAGDFEDNEVNDITPGNVTHINRVPVESVPFLAEITARNPKP